jgi:hypothetical protein
MFRGVLLAYPDLRQDYGEERWIGIGTTRGPVAVVAFAQPTPELLRIISLRKATSRESKEYERAIKDELETS